VPYTLLLADDSVTIQRVIELTFADEDVVVVAVSDGDQAIARLEASPPDIVLADIGMPGRNGYEVAQYIRRSPRLAHIPVVLLTGAFEPVDQARAAEAGCDGVLAKPFEPQLVISRVKELLARKNRPPATPAADVPRPSIVPDTQWAPPPAEPPFTRPSLEPAAPAALDDYFDRLDAAFSQLSPTPAPPTAAAAPGPDIDWFGTTAAGTPGTEPWGLPAPDRIEPPDLPLTHASPPPPGSLPSFAASTLADSFPEAASPAPVESHAALAAFAPDAVAEPVAPIAPLAAYAPDALSAPLAADVAPAPDSAPVAPWPPVAPVALWPPVAPDRPVELPALADAFEALLAAEQGEPLPATAAPWPGTTKTAPYDTGTLLSAAVDSDALVEDVTARVLDRLSDQVVRETVAEIVTRVAEQLIREEIERIKASIK